MIRNTTFRGSVRHLIPAGFALANISGFLLGIFCCSDGSSEVSFDVAATLWVAMAAALRDDRIHSLGRCRPGNGGWKALPFIQCFRHVSPFVWFGLSERSFFVWRENLPVSFNRLSVWPTYSLENANTLLIHIHATLARYPAFHACAGCPQPAPGAGGNNGDARFGKAVRFYLAPRCGKGGAVQDVEIQDDDCCARKGRRVHHRQRRRQNHPAGRLRDQGLPNYRSSSSVLRGGYEFGWAAAGSAGDRRALYAEQRRVLDVKPGVTGRVQLDSGEESNISRKASRQTTTTCVF